MKKNLKKQILNRKQFFAFEAYEKTAKQQLKYLNKAKKEAKLDIKEQQYFKFLYEFYYKLDTNIVELSKGIKLLFIKNNLMPSVFLLRGLTELIFFNIFVVFKSYLNIKKNNIDYLVDLILRASMATDVESIRSKSLMSESAIYKKIIDKYKGKRIHINDCIRFFKKRHIEDIVKTKENTKENCYKLLEELKDELTLGNFKYKREKIDVSIMMDIGLTMDRSRIIEAYDRMCEIIHPTAIKIYDAQDPEVQKDFDELFLHILDSGLFIINLYGIQYKQFIMQWFLDNKEEFIIRFNKKLN